jgi:hypothetical protein
MFTPFTDDVIFTFSSVMSSLLFRIADCRLPQQATSNKQQKSSSNMGRSQVERNRAKGRPGAAKGRGRGRGGGREAPNSVAPTKKKQPSDLGSNAWRYEENTRTGTTETDSSDNHDSLLTDSHNLYYEYDDGHLQESIEDKFIKKNPLGADSERQEVNTSNFDLGMMAKCLNKMSSADWMRIDNPRVLEEFNSRYVNSSEPKRMTVAERRLGGLDSNHNERIDSLVVDEEKQEEDEKSAGSSNVGSQEKAGGDEMGDEEDLDAWLDSVIS